MRTKLQSKASVLGDNGGPVYTNIEAWGKACRAPEQLALVELRFRKRGPNGELVPAPVARIVARRRVGGESVRAEDWWEFGGLGGGRPIQDALRLVASAPREGCNCLHLGRRYHLEYELAAPHEGITECESLLRVPKDIPAGKMQVITVIAEYPAGTFGD